VTGPARAATHKICPSCDLEITDGSAGAMCPRCGTKLVEIRDDGDDLIGTVIDGRFEIRDKVGQGGMGTVYRAWQRSVGREVAIKLIDRTYSRDPMSVRRFLREARLASQLSQPNTVSVFDFGQCDDGRLFIAMELIRGRTLHKVIEAEGVFSTERAVRVGVQICDALEAAHGAGIIHRDLKLENVIVLDDPPGRDLVKVLDFGLAKNIRDPGSRGTESGVVVGTPRYMAPETAMTGDSVPASDVYALGVMLGELAAGKPLWEGENLPHLVNQKLDPRPAIRLVPPPLDTVVGAMIDPEPERRPTAARARVMLVAAAEGPSADETLVDPASSEAKDTVSLRTPQPIPFDTFKDPPPAPVSTRAERVRTPLPVPSVGSEAFAPPRRGRRIVWLGIAAVVLGFGVGAIGVIASRAPAQTPASRDAAAPKPEIDDTTADEPAEPDAAPAPTTATIHIVSVPAGAEITFAKKNGPIVTAPGDLELALGTAKVQLRATLAGYAPQLFDVVPDADKPVTITLRKRAATQTRDDGPTTLPF
jgi:serine/threonine-protein kinase